MRDLVPLAWLLLAVTLLMLAPPGGHARGAGGAGAVVVFPSGVLRAT